MRKIVFLIIFGYIALQPVRAGAAVAKVFDQKLYVDGRRLFTKQAIPLFDFRLVGDDGDGLHKKLKEKQYNVVNYTLYWDMFDENGDGVVENQIALNNLKRYMANAKANGLYVTLAFNTYGVGGRGSNAGFNARHPEAQAVRYDGQKAYDTEYNPSCKNVTTYHSICIVESIFNQDFLSASRGFIKDLISKVDTSNVVWYETTVEPQYIGNQDIDYSTQALSGYYSKYGTTIKPAPNNVNWNKYRAESLGKWVSGDAMAIKQATNGALVAVDYLEVDSMQRRMGDSGVFLNNLTNIDIIQVNWHYGYCSGRKRCEAGYDKLHPLAMLNNWGISEHMTVPGDLVNFDINDLLSHTLEKGNKIGWNVITATPCSNNSFCVYKDDWSPKGNLAVLDDRFVNYWQPRALGLVLDVVGESAQIVETSMPNTVEAGKEYAVTIKVRNTGTKKWDGSLWADNMMGRYSLGDESARWGTNRIFLGTSDVIMPGGDKVFTIKVRAPTNPGSYEFKWQMVKELLGWFGQTLTKTVVVTAANPTDNNKQGDANNDGKADLVDFGEWRKGYLAHSTGSGLVADFNKDGKVDLVDFGEWRKGYLAR